MPFGFKVKGFTTVPNLGITALDAAISSGHACQLVAGGRWRQIKRGEAAAPSANMESESKLTGIAKHGLWKGTALALALK